MEKIKSDAYAIVSLALALYGILGTLAFFLSTRGDINIVNQVSSPTSLFITPIVPIIFGIIGLKSSAKKVAKAGITISIIEVVLKLFYFFVLPIIAVMIGGVG